MRHLLQDPAFPDIVAEWAEEEPSARVEPEWANDNQMTLEQLADPFLPLIIRAEIEATRVW